MRKIAPALILMILGTSTAFAQSASPPHGEPCLPVPAGPQTRVGPQSPDLHSSPMEQGEPSAVAPLGAHLPSLPQA